jgi:hypothetical protein
VLNALDSAIIQFIVSAGTRADFRERCRPHGAMNAPSWQALGSSESSTSPGIAASATQAHTLNLLALGDEEAASSASPSIGRRGPIVLARRF